MHIAQTIVDNVPYLIAAVLIVPRAANFILYDVVDSIAARFHSLTH
ncbi:hypothetical protein [Caballeronia sordidicola]|nr:hypothetical protein [Caballeronia sordidicola]